MAPTEMAPRYPATLIQPGDYDEDDDDGDVNGDYNVDGDYDDDCDDYDYDGEDGHSIFKDFVSFAYFCYILCI